MIGSKPVEKVSVNMKKTLLFLIGLFFIASPVYACPACVDSGLFYFYPFIGYWHVLLILWVLGRAVFNIIAKRTNILLPRLLLVYWLLLFLLSFLMLLSGGLVQFFAFVVFPSWLISYIRCFIKTWKQRRDDSLRRSFIVFQWATLLVFILMVPLSYIIPRKVPFNVRVAETRK